MHGARPYVVYWDRFTPEQWQQQEQAYQAEQARQREIAQHTVDSVNPGAQQSETDHKLQGDKTSSGDFSDRKFRHAVDGWFSYELKVLPDRAPGTVGDLLGQRQWRTRVRRTRRR